MMLFFKQRPFRQTIIVIFFISVLFSNKSYSETVEKNSTEISISGGMLKAANLAYSKFNIELAKIKIDTELSKFSSKIENYNVIIMENNNYYSLTMETKLYKGRMLKGGGASYTFSKNDFKLIEEKHYK